MNSILLAILSFAAMVTPAFRAHSAQHDAIDWQRGRELERELASPTSISVVGVPVDKFLADFSAEHGLGLFLDRRIDPGKLITINIQGQTKRSLLWQIAEQCEAGICQVGDVIYLGPQATAAILPELWADMLKASRANRSGSAKFWTQKAEFAASELAVPTEQLHQLATRFQFQINGPALPYDLWHQKRLPLIRIDEQVALWVIGFDRWFQLNNRGDAIELIPTPQVTSVKRLLTTHTDAKELLPELRQRFGDCRFSGSKQTITAFGPPELVLDAERWLNEQPSQQSRALQSTETATYSLQTRAPLGQILATVAQQEHLEFQFAPSLQAILEQPVAIHVQDVTLDQLLQELLDGTGLSYSIESGQLRIH